MTDLLVSGVALLLLLLVVACVWALTFERRWGDALAEAAQLRRRVRWLEAELAAQRQLTQANAAALLAGVYGISQESAATLLEARETLTEEEYGRE